MVPSATPASDAMSATFAWKKPFSANTRSAADRIRSRLSPPRAEWLFIQGACSDRHAQCQVGGRHAVAKQATIRYNSTPMARALRGVCLAAAFAVLSLALAGA